MRKLVYEIKDTEGNIIQTVTTLEEKKTAEKNGYNVTEKFEEINNFQPWKKKEERTNKFFEKYKNKFRK